eukprot:6902741-Alexandrium_andersonii.AAC.1
MSASLVGSEMCIRDRLSSPPEIGRQQATQSLMSGMSSPKLPATVGVPGAEPVSEISPGTVSASALCWGHDSRWDMWPRTAAAARVAAADATCRGPGSGRGS